MSRSLNKVQLIGNLGADPEVRSTSGGNRVATFSLATSRSWNGPAGDKQEKTEWHRCVVWNSKVSQLADIVERYLKKGDKVYVEGRIEYRQWQDKENQTRYMTEINVRELIMLSGRAGAGADGMDGEAAPARVRGASDRARGAAAGAGSSGAGGSGTSGAGGGEFEDFKGNLEEEDDDLPF